MEKFETFFDILSTNKFLESSKEYFDEIGSSMGDFIESIKQDGMKLDLSKTQKINFLKFLIEHGEDYFPSEILERFCGMLKPPKKMDDWHNYYWEEYNKQICKIEKDYNEIHDKYVPFIDFPPTGTLYDLSFESREKNKLICILMDENHEQVTLDSIIENNTAPRKKKRYKQNHFDFAEFFDKFDLTLKESENQEKNQDNLPNTLPKFSESEKESIINLKEILIEDSKFHSSQRNENTDEMKLIKENYERMEEISEIFEIEKSEDSLISTMIDKMIKEDLSYKIAFNFLKFIVTKKIENSENMISRILLDSIIFFAKKNSKAFIDGLIIPLFNSKEHSPSVTEIIYKSVLGFNEEMLIVFYENCFNFSEDKWQDSIILALEKIFSSKPIPNENLIEKIVFSFEKQSLFLESENTKFTKLAFTFVNKNLGFLKPYSSRLMTPFSRFGSTLSKALQKKLENIK